MILVSHDANALQEYCDRGVLLNEGHLVSAGPISDVVKDYIDLLNRSEGATTPAVKTTGAQRWGTGDVVVEACEIFATPARDGVTAPTTDPSVVFTEADEEIRRARSLPS